MFNQRNWDNDTINQRKFNVKKKTKVKIINDFIADEKTLNAKTFKKDEDNI